MDSVDRINGENKYKGDIWSNEKVQKDDPC